MQAVDLALPEELAQGITCFKVDLCLCLQLCGQLAPFSLHNASMTCCCPQAFYEKQNQHRKLTWYYSLGMTVVKANFDARPIELSMSHPPGSDCRPLQQWSACPFPAPVQKGWEP